MHGKARRVQSFRLYDLNAFVKGTMDRIGGYMSRSSSPAGDNIAQQHHPLAVSEMQTSHILIRSNSWDISDLIQTYRYLLPPSQPRLPLELLLHSSEEDRTQYTFVTALEIGISMPEDASDEAWKAAERIQKIKRGDVDRCMKWMVYRLEETGWEIDCYEAVEDWSEEDMRYVRPYLPMIINMVQHGELTVRVAIASSSTSTKSKPKNTNRPNSHERHHLPSFTRMTSLPKWIRRWTMDR